MKKARKKVTNASRLKTNPEQRTRDADGLTNLRFD